MEEIAHEFFGDPIPKYTGNFCIILCKNNKITVSHDIDRAFPLAYYNNEVLTNLLYAKEKIKNKDDIWSDSIVEYSPKGIRQQYIGRSVNFFKEEHISVDECVNNVKSVLMKKIERSSILKSSNVINIFLSGGVDTSLVFSLLANHSEYINKLNVIAEEHFEFSAFTLKNQHIFTKSDNMWGYRQFHHWKAPTIYATGGMGDEILMRSPTTAALWCAWNDINLIEILSDEDYFYHKKYFLLDKNKNIIQDNWINRKKIQEKFLNYSELCNEIISIVSNDHQHWHLENTLSWTPLKDMRLLKNILRLPKTELLNQITSATIDKNIISNLFPEMNKYICTHKNHDTYNNLVKFPTFFEKIKYD